MIQLKKFLRKMEKLIQKNIIMGDWNSVIGDEPYRNIAGSHGIGRRKHRRQMLIDFVKEMD